MKDKKNNIYVKRSTMAGSFKSSDIPTLFDYKAGCDYLFYLPSASGKISFNINGIPGYEHSSRNSNLGVLKFADLESSERKIEIVTIYSNDYKNFEFKSVELKENAPTNVINCETIK